MNRDTKMITNAAGGMHEIAEFIATKTRVPVTVKIEFNLNQGVERGGPTGLEYELTITGSQDTTVTGRDIDELVQRACARFGSERAV